MLSRDGRRFVVPGRPIGTDEPIGWHLIDLSSGESNPLLALSDRRYGDPANYNNWLWRPLLFVDESLIFYWNGGWDKIPARERRALLRYDLGAGSIELVDGNLTKAHTAYACCAQECRRFVLDYVGRKPSIVTCDRDRRSPPTEVWLQPDLAFSFQDWSPDDSLLLVLTVDWLGFTDEVIGYDQDGFAALDAALDHDEDEDPAWKIYEYRVIDASDGRTRLAFRAAANQCGPDSHRAEWSPNGRWFVVAGGNPDCVPHP